MHVDTLRALRAIGPALEYFVEPTGTVLLLEWQPGKARERRGRSMLERGIRTIDAQLMAENFSLLAALPRTAIDTGLLLARAQRILSMSADDIRTAHEKQVARADGTEAEEKASAIAIDRMRAEGHSDHAIIFRHRKSFTSAGIPS